MQFYFVSFFSHQEVEHLGHLEETTLSSDLAQGYALKSLVELLWLFVGHLNIFY